jgi:hypothetical protein
MSEAPHKRGWSILAFFVRTGLMDDVIDEPILVGAVFSNGIKPVWFMWNNKKHTVKEVTYRWKDRIGEAVVHHFSVVSDTGTIYEITFNSKTLDWRLRNVEV